MAIEVSDGFGIVFRAIELDYQTFLTGDIRIKNFDPLKIVTNDDKNKQQKSVWPGSMTTERRAPNTKHDANPKSYDLLKI